MRYAVVKFKDDERVRKIVSVSIVRETISRKPFRPKAAHDFRTKENFYEVKWQKSDLSNDGYYEATVLLLAKTVQDARAKAAEKGIKLLGEALLLEVPSSACSPSKEDGVKRKSRRCANDGEQKKSLQSGVNSTSSEEPPRKAKTSAHSKKSDKQQSAAPSKPKPNRSARDPVLLEKMKLVLDAAKSNPLLMDSNGKISEVKQQAPQETPIKDKQVPSGKSCLSPGWSSLSLNRPLDEQSQDIGENQSEDKTPIKKSLNKTPNKKTPKERTPKKMCKKTPDKDKPSLSETIASAPGIRPSRPESEPSQLMALFSFTTNSDSDNFFTPSSPNGKEETSQKIPKKDKPSSVASASEMTQFSSSNNSNSLKRKCNDDNLSSPSPQRKKSKNPDRSVPDTENSTQLSDGESDKSDNESLTQLSDGEAEKSDNESKSSGDFSCDSDGDDDVVLLSKKIDALKNKCKELEKKIKVQELTIKFCDSEMKTKSLANKKLQTTIEYLMEQLRKVHTITGGVIGGKIPQSGDAGVMSACDSGFMPSCDSGTTGGDANETDSSALKKVKKNLFSDMMSSPPKPATIVTSTPKVKHQSSKTEVVPRKQSSSDKGKKKVPLINHKGIESVAEALSKHTDKFMDKNLSLPVNESGMFQINNTSVDGKMLVQNIRKHHKNNLGLMTRNLTTLMWTALERRGRSLQGRASNRFKDVAPKTAATPEKVDLILGTVKFVLRDLQGMQECDAMEAILKQQRTVLGNRLNQEDQKVKRTKNRDDGSDVED